MSIKVGDIVRIKENNYYSGSKGEAGKHGIVRSAEANGVMVEVGHSPGFHSTDSTGNNFNLHYSVEQVELIKEEKQMTKFKEGDRVRAIGRQGGYALTGGNEGDVTRITASGGVKVMFDGRFSTLTFLESELDDLELIETGVKVGDVFSSRIQSYNRLILAVFEDDGEKYVVTKDTDDGSKTVRNLENMKQEGWSLADEEVELTLEQIAEKFGIEKSALRIKE